MKLLQASDRDVHAVSKQSTLPIAREIVQRYVFDETKAPWYIDLLNINLNNYDLQCACERIGSYMQTFKTDGTRITENLDTAADGNDELGQFQQEIAELQLWMNSP